MSDTFQWHCFSVLRCQWYNWNGNYKIFSQVHEAHCNRTLISVELFLFCRASRPNSDKNIYVYRKHLNTLFALYLSTSAIHWLCNYTLFTNYVWQSLEFTLIQPVTFYSFGSPSHPTDSEFHELRSEVTLRLTVGQSVCLGVEPLWDLQPDINSVGILLCCLCWAPSLTRGRVCLLSATVSNNCLLSIFLFWFFPPILHVIYFMYIQYTQGLVSPGSVQQILLHHL
jgi:hypothetical protein